MSNSSEIYELAESAASYAGKLYNGLDNIVADLRGDNVKEGLNTFAQATEGLDWMMNAITKLKSAGSPFTEFDTGTISDFLSEMLEAAENMDYVLLTDLIEYEILPIIDEWGNKLDDYLETAGEK